VSRGRWLLVGGGIVVAAALIALLLRPSGSNTSPSGPAVIGAPAPTIVGTGLDGKTVRLADFKGRTVLVNFWASWCNPCRQEFPVFRDLLEKDPSVTVIGVVFNDYKTTAKAFSLTEDATWPSVLDSSGRIAKAYGVAQKPGIPVTFTIDANGILRDKHLGPVPSDFTPPLH
jgi:cytochrome c biogenesis protein CcmG, thiol:disulfide interchange protein DsbE